MMGLVPFQLPVLLALLVLLVLLELLELALVLKVEYRTLVFKWARCEV